MDLAVVLRCPHGNPMAVAHYQEGDAQRYHHALGVVLEDQRAGDTIDYADASPSFVLGCPHQECR